MLKKIKEVALSIGMMSLLVAPIMATAAVSADTITGDLCSGSQLTTTGADDTTACDDSDGLNVDSIMTLVINIFSIIVGFIAVIMIIVGGVKYITSGGDSGNISGAKNTIVYAVIGLIVVALAQILVHFVLQKLAGASESPSPN